MREYEARGAGAHVAMVRDQATCTRPMARRPPRVTRSSPPSRRAAVPAAAAATAAACLVLTYSTARRAPPQHPPPAAGPATVRARTRHADLDIDRAVTRGRSACAAAASRAANIHLSLESGRLLRAELLTLLNNELKFSQIINNVMSATRLYHSLKR